MGIRLDKLSWLNLKWTFLKAVLVDCMQVTQPKWWCHIFSIHQGLSRDIHKFSKSGGGLEDQCKYRSFQTCLCCLYLFKLYKKSTIILLASSLTNIRSEISKIQLILWMIYTCNVEGLQEVKKKRWLDMNVLRIVDQDH